MKSCPKCLQENDDAANYCVLCRSPFNAGGALTCPKGHVLDPTWTECVYCGLDKTPAAAAVISPSSRPKTVVEDMSGVPVTPSGPPPLPPPPASIVDSASGRPQFPVGGGRRGKTVYVAPPEQDAAPGAEPRQQDRKILGVLVTYSWKPGGQVFPVREGRNLIGRGAECEIQVPEDATLSNVNTHITFRKNFTIGDMVSMSGTDLEGEPIEEQFVPLGNYARIRTGSTHWTFVILEPSPTSAE
jgi:hypothetical protein